MIRRNALVVATAVVLGSTPAVAGTVEESPSAEAWNAIVAVGTAGEVTVVRRSGEVEELDRLVDATGDTRYVIAHAGGARVVAADDGGSGRLAVIDAASGETHHFEGYGGADPVPGSSQLVRTVAEEWPNRLIVDVGTLDAVRLGADELPSSANEMIASADDSMVAFIDPHARRSWLLTVASGQVDEAPGRVVGFVAGAPVIVRLDGDTASYSVPVDGGTRVVTTSALAEFETIGDGTVVVVEPTGQVRLIAPEGIEREVGRVTINHEPYTDYDGYVDLFVANLGSRFVVETENEVHLFDSTGRSLATFEVDRFGVTYHWPGIVQPRCVRVGGGLVLDTEYSTAFEPFHDPLESSSDGCVFATQSSRSPAFYIGDKRFELERGTDIVGVSPDGSLGIAYRDGWYWTFDLRSPSDSFRQILQSSEANRTFGFVTI